jgi:poly(A) polymerase
VTPQETDANHGKLIVIPRSEHSISRQNIEREALKVLYRLHRLGFRAYLVGGGVRDLLLKRRPKDYDVATDARPNRLRKIFRNCRVIGRRFRLVHVLFSGNRCVEVSTFRRSADFALKQENGLILQDNTFGTPEEDARRRDLTINGLFYDIATFSVLDYVGGVEDLEDGIIRTISEPDQSFREDPVRMIRALRHGARLGFDIEENTYAAIQKHRELLTYTNPSRLTEEIFRDLRGGAAQEFFRRVLAAGLLTYLFPELTRQLQRDRRHVLWDRLAAMDQMIAAGRELPNSVLVTVLLHSVLLPREIDAPREGQRKPVDVGRLVDQRLRSLRAHFRLSLQACNRVVQIIMARRRLRSVPGDRGLPKSLLGKAYLPDALLLHEVFERADGKPVDRIAQHLRQSETVRRERRRSAEGEAPARRRPRRSPRRRGRARRRKPRPPQR